jgi:hypothetical protein
MARDTEFDRDMQMLEAEIKRLETEYNMFFAGRLPRPPWETRKRVDGLVKRFDRTPLRNTAERFRFASVQTRYVKVCEVFDKMLRAREEGRPVFGRPQTHERQTPESGQPPTTPGAEAPPADAARQQQGRERVVHVAAFKDPAAESDRLQELYERLAAARRDAGEQQIPYQQFAAVVRAQVNKLGGGAGEVGFKVAVKDGKVTLTAKAMGGE